MLNKLMNKTLEFLGETDDFGLKGAGSKFSDLENSANDFMQGYSLSELLPYETFDPESGLFFNKQGAGFVLEMMPMMGSNDEMDRQLSGIFQHTLPVGSSIQFLMVASQKVDSLFENWLNPRKQTGGIYETLAKRRVEFLKKKVLNATPQHPFLLRNFKVIMSVSLPKPPSNEVEIEKAISLKEQLLTTFQGAGAQAFAWDANDLIRGLDEILNLNDRLDTPPLEWNPLDDLASQIVSPETVLKVEKDALRQQFGKKEMRCYTARYFPNQWAFGAMGEFLGSEFNNFAQISMPFLIHYGVNICSEKTLQARILAKCTQAERTANSPIAKWLPNAAREAAELGFVREQLNSGERFIRTRFQVLLMGDSKKMDIAEQQLVNLYRQNRFGLSKDVYLMLPSLMSVLPMSWGEGMVEQNLKMSNMKTTLSYEAINLLPLQGEWRGTPSPGMLLVSRKGQLSYWDPIDSKGEGGNFNVGVVGKPGSGKSAFMNELVMTTLGCGGRVFVLDVGRSFEKQVKKNSNGQFIEFGRGSQICLNPFSSFPTKGSRADRDDALVMLKSIVCTMASPTQNIDTLSASYIESAIKVVLSKKGNDGCVGDVSDELLKHQEKEGRSLGEVLKSYGPGGTYGRFFTGKSNIDLKAKFVVVELEELKGNLELQPVVIQILILEIANQVYLGDRKTVFRVFLDEAWDLLRGGQMKIFIETAARRFRKYEGGLIVGTQSVNDFYANEGAQACFENSDWLMAFAQKDSSISMLKKSGKLEMTEQTERQLRSLKLCKGQYSEALLQGPNGSSVVRIMLDPFSNILYSTNADEHAKVKDYQASGLSLDEAIEQVAKEAGLCN